VVRLVAPLALVGLVAAACSDDDDGSSGGTSATASSANGTGGPAACTVVGLAFLGPQTGPQSALGLDEARAVELAIREFNVAHPACQVAYQAFDTDSGTTPTPVVAQQIARDPSIVGVVGLTSVTATVAAMPLLEAGGVAVITPSASDPSLATSGWSTFHRVIANSDEQAAGSARSITGSGEARSIAVIDDGSDAGQRRAKVVGDAATKAGASVDLTRSVDDAAADAALVADVRAADVDAVAIVGDADVAARVVGQLRQGGVSAKVVVGEGGLDPGFLAGAGARAEGVEVVAGVLASVDGYPDGTAFAARFRAATGQDPGLYAAAAYDATTFLLAAIASGATTRAAVTAFLATQGSPGVTQPLQFEANGELAGDPAVYANAVQGGRVVGVGPIAP
jgi:branched-chain amino acid transport system substrate-binding protein